MEKTKDVLKKVLGKIPVFIFCVVFINGYNKLFGAENSIAGVILLMALLMFLGSNFGFNYKAESLSIPLMFVFIGVAARLSSINPLVGFIVNAITLILVLLITRFEEGNSGFLAYMMGYLMFRGYNVTGDLFNKRILSFVIIGSFIGLIYYFINKKKDKEEREVKDIFHMFSMKDKEDRWHITFAITLMLTMLLGDIIDFPKSMWVNLTVLSLMSPVKEEIESRRKARIPATILGSIIFFALFGYLIPENYQVTITLMAGFLSMFITSYFIKVAYNSFSALVTASLMFPAGKAVIIRIVANILGAGITIISFFVFEKVYEKIDKNNNLINV